MPEKGIAALGRFARVVSDAGGQVLDLLAGALFENVSPDGVAVFALGADGKLRLAASRAMPAATAEIEVDFDDAGELPEKVRAACGHSGAQVNRPLVAGAALYGEVILLSKIETELQAGLAEGLIDLAAVALGNAAHVAQLERQFTELRQQQEILARTEKLRALGQMAAGVSHDLGNILNPLSLHLQIIGRALERGKTDDAKESAVEMKGVLQRGLQTLDRLRKFSRQSDDTATIELVELDRLARESVEIGKARAASSGGRLPKIVEELTAPPPVKASSAELVSALVNLVVNAIDAKAKTITLRSGQSEKGPWIEVADDGPGMPPEVAQRVFEPFFTTKGEQGTGLGLAMVHTSMERYGGSVTIDTEPGRGTSFRLCFPKATPQL